MNEVTLRRALVNPKRYLAKPVTLEGLEELPVDSVVRTNGGQPLLAYVRLWEQGDPELEALRAMLLPLPIDWRARGNGMPVRSVPFGLRGRALPRWDHCTSATLDQNFPEASKALSALGRKLEREYSAIAPGVFAHHVAQAGRLLDDWRLEGSACFTGGVINRDCAIGWHFDTGNFTATFSAMPVFRQHMDGGELCVPELGVYLTTPDGTAVFFDGQSLLHGVTPLTARRHDAHRFSVVYYSERKLWNCLPPALEVERVQERRTDRELRRMRGNSPRTA
jgi:hypothetical protein